MQLQKPQFKEWRIPPMGASMKYAPTQLIRFMWDYKQGMLDVRNSYLQVTVAVDPTKLPTGGIQLDSSALSLFSQMILYSNSQQIERITDYSSVGSVLVDLSYSQLQTQNKQNQGLGFLQATSLPPQLSPCGGSVEFAMLKPGTPQPGLEYTLTVANPSGVFPYNLPINTASTFLGGSSVNKATPLVPTGQSPTALSMTGIGPQIATPPYGYFLPCLSRVDTSMIATTSPYIMEATSTPAIRLNPVTGQTTVAPTPIGGGSYLPNTAASRGFLRAVNPSLSKGCWQPIISPSIPYVNIANGVPLKTPLPITQRTFQAPLISGVMGSLCPPNLRYIPLAFLPNMVLQLRMNPYAFFSTGCDISGKPLPRDYYVTKIELVMALALQDGAAQREIISRGGMTVDSQTYQLGPVYNVALPASLKNSWPINNGVRNLKNIFTMFYSGQYQIHPFCRRLYRFSRNIRAYQLKIGGKFYPPQPIVGNSGNPVPIDQTGSNGAYFLPIKKLTGGFMSVQNSVGRINHSNFALNCRLYDSSRPAGTLTVTSTGTLGGQTLITFPPQIQIPYPTPTSPSIFLTNGFTAQPTLQQSVGFVNYDTSLGWPYYHQNRAVGRALYVYPFQVMGQGTGGIDTTVARPFQLQLDVQIYQPPQLVKPSTASAAMATEMVTLLNIGMRVEYSMQGVRTSW